MHTRFLNWIRAYLLIGLLASMLNAMPAQASAIHYSKSFAAPAKPVLVSPAKGTLVKTITPTLKWKVVNGATYYRVQVAYDSGFGDLVKDDTTTNVAYVPTLPPGTRFYWRVRAFNASDEASPWSAVWNFKTPLVPPVLVAPTAGEVLFTDRPTFEWNPVFTATQYILQVSAQSTFSTLLVNTTVKATQPTTKYTMTKDLPQNKTLYWRVRSKSSTLTSGWSPKQTFKTGNPPSVPVLVAPALDALVNDYTPLFNWNNSTVPSVGTFKQYEIQVDDNNDFSSPEVDTTTTPVTESQYTHGLDLASNTKYFWRVRAVQTIDGNDHFSGWSKVWSFRAAIPAPTGLTVIPNGLKPTFQWDDATATPSGTISGYTIQISAKQDFSTLLVNSTPVNSQYTPGSNLPAGKTLYFRVRVNGANGPSAWSSGQFATP